MAGARIEIDVQVPGLAQAVQELQADERRTLLGDIGEYLLRSTRDRAAREIDPDGAPWRALSPRYKRYKDKKRPGVPKLKFDAHMLGDRLAWQVQGATLRVGTSAKYGAIHQFGGDIDIPARKTQVNFRRDSKTGVVGNRFVKKRHANFSQDVMSPAYKVHIPARPFLGVSTDDETEIQAIVAQHLDELLKHRSS